MTKLKSPDDHIFCWVQGGATCDFPSPARVRLQNTYRDVALERREKGET